MEKSLQGIGNAHLDFDCQEFRDAMLMDNVVDINLEKDNKRGYVCYVENFEDRVESAFSFSEFDNAEALRADLQQFIKNNFSQMSNKQALPTLQMIFGVDRKMEAKALNTVKDLIEMLDDFIIMIQRANVCREDLKEAFSFYYDAERKFLNKHI